MRKTPEAIERVLVFRIGSLGDTCVAMPALHLVRRTFPCADIRLLSNMPRGGTVRVAPVWSVVEGSSVSDGYFEYSASSLREVWKTWRRLRAWHPHVIVYMMPTRTLAQRLRDWVFLGTLGAYRIIGLHLVGDANEHLPEQGGFREREAARILRSLRVLGSVDLHDSRTWSLELNDADEAAASAALKGFDVPFVACSIGANMDVKDWGLDNWVQWAERVSSHTPALGLVMFGSSEQREQSDVVCRGWKGPSLNVCGTLTPRQSAAAIRRARLYAGHDSGPMHLAASVGVRCVAVFSARCAPGIWFPLGDGHHVLYNKTSCFGCGLTACLAEGKRCIRGIEVEQVVGAAIARLNAISPQPPVG